MTAALPTVTAKPELATATGGTVRTRLTDALEIEHPVMLAGMGGVSYHRLVDAVGDRVPVVAAGGLFDGRGLAASLALGADGVWIGTRFIATPEARSTPGYKDALLHTAEDGTVVSRAFTGKTLRAVRNKTTQYYDDHPGELRPFPDQLFKAVEEGTLHLTGGDEAAGVDPDRECYPAGQATGAIDALVPAGELVRRFVAEAEAVIESLGGLRAQTPA